VPLAPSDYRRLLLTYLTPQSRRVGILAVLLLGSIGLQLVGPQFLRSFIDQAQAGADPTALALIATTFIIVALIQQGLAIAATYFSEHVGWTATNALRADLALHCLRLDLSFHKARTPGELIERIDGDVTALATFFSEFVIQMLGNLLLLIGVMAALWFVDWRVALVMTLYVTATLIAINATRSFTVPYWTAFRQSSAKLYGFLEERLAGTEDIRSSGAAAYIMQRLFAHTRERIRTGRKARLLGGIQWSLPIVLFAAGTALSFVVTAYLYTQGAMTLGTAFLVYTYTGLSFRPLHLISRQIEEFQKASAGIVRIQELMGIQSVLIDGPGAPLPPGPLSIEFDHVEFGYGDDEMVVHDLTFRFEPGTVTGVLGRTGSGKTTLTRLLFRLYDPASGCVRLGGVDLRDARRSDIRRCIGLVTQDVQLFTASIRANVTFFDPTIDDSEILSAFDALGLLEWCRSLPAGLDTMLGAGGRGLSAGEAQLLAFTRVFLKDPGLVILDEASSRLDPATERLIERAVGSLLEGRTGIIIAHRLGTVQRASQIVILEGGRVRESGPRERLARDPHSLFHALLAVSRQGEGMAQESAPVDREIVPAHG